MNDSISDMVPDEWQGGSDDFYRQNNAEKTNFRQYRILTDLLNQGEECYTFLPNVIPEKMINYKDLVFTLTRNGEQYVRPVVELENYGFIVKGNNIMFRAGKEAGLKSFICDVNIKTFSDKHFSQFQLMEPTRPYSSFSVHAVLFLDVLNHNVLKREVSSGTLSDEVFYKSRIKGIQNFGLDIKFHSSNEAIEYKILKENAQQYKDIYLKEQGLEKMKIGLPVDYSNLRKDPLSLCEKRKMELDAEFESGKTEHENHLIVSQLYSSVKKYGRIRSINGIIVKY